MQPNPANSNAALAQLQKQQSLSQNPNDILSGQRQQLGVQQAQDTVTGLRGAINNTTKLLKQVAPSVMGRTGSSLVTNAQASRQIQNEQAPISQNLTQEGTDYNNANSDLNNLQNEASQAASGIYQGQQDKQSYLQNIYSTLYGREQDAKAAKIAEQSRREQIREFNAQLAESRRASNAANSFSPSLGGDNNKSKNTPPLQQLAYNDVKTRVTNSENDRDIVSDYNATKSSADRGNKKDQYKLQFYQQLRPDLFKNGNKQIASQALAVARGF